MHPAGQPEDEPALDRPESERAVCCCGPYARVIVEQPAHLGAGEIGVEQQAGLFLHQRLLPGFLQRGAEIGRPAILPDDGARQRLARASVPRHHRLALVGDTDGRDVFGPLSHRLAHAGQRLLPDFFRIVFDPAGAGIMLRQFGLRDRGELAVAAEDHGACRCRPGIEDQNAFGHEISLLAGGW